MGKKIIFLIIAIGFLLTISIFTPTAEGFGPKTNLFAANNVLSDLTDEDGIFLINGETYGAHPIINASLTEFPEYYRGGAIAPYTLPDIYFGQKIIHEGPATYDNWLERIRSYITTVCPEPTLNLFWNIPVDDADDICKKIIAFYSGIMSHAAGDMWSNGLINEFTTQFNPSQAESTKYLVEKYIDDHVPDSNEDIDFLIYEGFVYNTFIKNPDRPNKGEIFNYFFDLQDHLENSVLEDLEETLDELEDDRVILLGWEACYCIPPTPLTPNPCFNPNSCTQNSVDIAINELEIDETKDKIRHVERWIENIEDGLEDWPQFGHAVAQSLIIDNDINSAQSVASNFVSSTLAGMMGDHGTSGFSDQVFLNIVRSPVPPILDDYETDFFDNLVFFGFGIDATSFELYFNDPQSHLHSFIKQNIDGLMYPDSSLNFDPQRFSAVKNTIMSSKVMLLNQTALNELLCDNRVGPMYHPIDPLFKCPPDVEEPSPIELTTCRIEATRCAADTPQTECLGGYTFTTVCEPIVSGPEPEDSEEEESLPITFPNDSELLTISGEGDECYVENGELICDHPDVIVPQVNIFSNQQNYSLGEYVKIGFEASPDPFGVVGLVIYNSMGDQSYTSDNQLDDCPLELPGTADWRRCFYLPNTQDAVGNWKVIAKLQNTESELILPVSETGIKHENEMLDYINRINGDQQWRITTYPDQNRYGDGMPLWLDCPSRERVFRTIYEDWDHVDYSKSQFPDFGELAIIGTSNTPPPTGFLEVNGPIKVEEGFEGPIYRVGPVTNFTVRIFTDLDYFWQHREDKVLSYSSIENEDSSTVGLIGQAQIGNQTFGPIKGPVGDYLLMYHSSGLCANVLEEGQIQEDWHIFPVSFDLGLAPPSLLVLTDAFPLQSNDKIKRYYAKSGSFIGDLVGGDEWSDGLRNPTSMSYGPLNDFKSKNSVYVLNMEGDALMRFSSTTIPSEEEPGEGLTHLPHALDLTFDAEGNVYFITSLRSAIFRYDTEGNISTFIPENSGGLQSPTSLTFGPGDNYAGRDDPYKYNQMGSGYYKYLYVADSTTNSIKKFNATDGQFIDNFAVGGGLSEPKDMIFGPDDYMYVSSFNTNQIKRYSQSGSGHSFIPPGEGGIDGPWGLAFDEKGRLFVSSYNSNEVFRYEILDDGTINSVTFVTEESGGLMHPTSLLFWPPEIISPPPPPFQGGPLAWIEEMERAAFVINYLRERGFVIDIVLPDPPVPPDIGPLFENKKYVEILIDGGLNMIFEEKLDEATFIFDSFIQYQPDMPQGYMGKGTIFLEKQQFPEAINNFDIALEIDPGNEYATSQRETALAENGGGCLIATATFGSELAPQVQQLRELRDNTLLQTDSGSVFMTGFNQFYYSFSPTIADLERKHPIFKEAVKLTITPLITSLSLLNYVDMDSESEVLGYGISLILLNLGMYFVAPALVIWKLRKFYP